MRRLTVQLCALVTAVVVLASVQSVQPASADDHQLLWGAHPNTRVGETKWHALERVRRSAGRKLETVRRFYLWNDDTSFPTDYDRALINDGTTLVISVKAKQRGTTDVPWARIASARPGDGVYQRMQSWAARVRDIGAPVYVSFNHEPESKANDGRGSATDFIEAWRQWVRVFRREGATNARMMWIMTDQSYWLPWWDRRAAARWYPGDPWVDGIAGDAYNWHECRPGIVNGWRSLRDIIEPQRQFWLDHQSKELWLTEYGSTEDPDRPGRKADWLRQAKALFATPAFSVYDGVMLFEDVPSYPCTWSVDTSSSADAAWAEWGADPLYGRTQPRPAFGGATYPPGGVPPRGTVAFVVDDPAQLREGAAAVTRLRAQGYTVRVLDDGVVRAADVTDADAVLITQNARQSALGTRLRFASVPVVVWKPSLFDEMGLASGTNGRTATTTQVDIVAGAHPLAAGLAGRVVLTTRPDRLPIGSPASAADVVARAGATPTLFEFDAGEQMTGLRAPDCRIAATVPADGIGALTADGLALFDAAVAHAVAGCP